MKREEKKGAERMSQVTQDGKVQLLQLHITQYILVNHFVYSTMPLEIQTKYLKYLLQYIKIKLSCISNSYLYIVIECMLRFVNTQ